MIVEDGSHRAIGSCANLQRTAASGIDPVAAEALVEADDAEASSKALLGMRPVGKNALAQQRNIRPHRRGFALNPFNRPVGKAAMRRGHMIGDRRVLAVAAGAPVSGNSLALVEDLDRIGGDTSLDLLAGKAIGNGIIVPLDLDVIIQPGAPDTPFGKDITFDRQRSQSRTIKLLEQLAARGADTAQNALIIEIMEQLANRRIDLGQTIEDAMAQPAQQPTFDDTNRSFRGRRGRVGKTALP